MTTKTTIVACALAAGITLAFRYVLPDMPLAVRFAMGALVGIACCAWASTRKRPVVARRRVRRGRR